MDKALHLTSPSVILMASQDKSFVGLPVHKAFHLIAEKLQILQSLLPLGRPKNHTNDPKTMEIRRFKHEAYNLAFRVKKEMPSRNIYLENNPLYSFVLKSNLLSSKSLKSIQVFMTPRDSEMEGIQKSRLSLDCPHINNETCRIYLTYSVRVTNLSPTPYDTDCKNY